MRLRITRKSFDFGAEVQIAGQGMQQAYRNFFNDKGTERESKRFGVCYGMHLRCGSKSQTLQGES